jgi:hypothetical protein
MHARRRLPGVIVMIASVAGAILTAPATGSATTGDTYVLPPSQYLVPPSVMSQYYGSYRISSIGTGAQLYAANIFITQNQDHDLYGGGIFYGYDSQGQQDSWTNVLYDFHLVPPGPGEAVRPWTTPGQTANDVLAVTLFGWGTPPLGTMRLRRSPDGDLTGSIQLIRQKTAYAISFHRFSSHP